MALDLESGPVIVLTEGSLLASDAILDELSSHWTFGTIAFEKCSFCLWTWMVVR